MGPPDPIDGSTLTDEELADAIASQSPTLVKRYAPFDYAFVRRRLREWFEFQRTGSRGLSRRIAEQQDRKATSKRRDAAREMAAGIGEIRRYLPVIHALQQGQTVQEALTVKVPLVGVGISL